MNLRDNDLESTGYDCKLQIKSQENHIISQKEYFIKFRPYLVEMLRALRPFFELIVYTSKTKSEAELLVNEIEKEDNFFTYIVPSNYCYFL